MDHSKVDHTQTALLLVALSGLLSGLAFYAAGLREVAGLAWSFGVLPVLGALVLEILRSLWRGEVGLDIVAALSMIAALGVGETLAASVVALMYSGGTFLEGFAEGRARRDMHDLLSRVPRSATRHRHGSLEEVPLDAIRPGDRLLIRQGEIVPVDGTVASGTAFVDTSALTGESLPVRLAHASAVMSGSTNAGDAFDLGVTRPASDSTYAGIVRLVAAAQKSRAPGDPGRAVAVLVIATPCPLILAVPVALVAGLSRAAHFGVLIKGAGALERMARVTTLILDKTGTLTDGRPQIVAIDSAGGMAEDAILRLAAALDQASTHPVAQAVVAAATARGLVLPLPSDVVENAGEGVTGMVAGQNVVVGGHDFVAGHLKEPPGHYPALAAGAVLVAVAADGCLVGHLVMADPLRDGTARTLGTLRRQGINRILLATGDRAEVAQKVAGGLGLDAIRAGLRPDQKVALVQQERRNGLVMMVGDGVNDAPSLAAADVGVAMGARGAAASAEAADVVLLVDKIDRLGQGVEIARRSLRIAGESVAAGIGLSFLGMLAAAFGYLTPVEGALIQEVIDVAVILNALRALRIVPKAALFSS